MEGHGLSSGEHRCSLGWQFSAAGLFPPPLALFSWSRPSQPCLCLCFSSCQQTCFVITFLQHWELSPVTSSWLVLCCACHTFGDGLLLLGIPEASLLAAGPAPEGLEPAFISLQCLALLGRLFLLYCATRGRLIQPANVWVLFFTSP